MDRREALKVMAGAATLLTSGVAVAAPRVETPPEPEARPVRRHLAFGRPEGDLRVLVTLTIPIARGDVDTTWVPSRNVPSARVPSSVFIDRVNTAIEELLDGPFAPDLDQPIRATFAPDPYEHEVTMKAAEFFKRHGSLVSRALDLSTYQVGHRFVQITMTEETAKAKLWDVIRQLRANTTQCQLRIWMLPKRTIIG
jgi:hypothetical protein